MRILHFTDLHLLEDLKAVINGVRPYVMLETVLAKALSDAQKKQPQLVLITGDVSQDYSLKSYKITAKLFKKFNCALGVTAGNHDYLGTLNKAFMHKDEECAKFFRLKNWRIILLNSHWDDNVAGLLADSELEFLEKKLADSNSHPVMVFLHHQVVPVGSAWLDSIGLANKVEFLKIVTKYPSIKAVVSGHVHQTTTCRRHGVQFISSPATSWQFAVMSSVFKLDTLMPGYRWFDLNDNGTFKTGIARIKYDAALLPDLKSEGY